MNCINKKQIDLYKKAKFNKPSLPVKRSARASIGPYDSRTHCLFCGNEIVKASSSGIYSEEYSCVKTDTFVETVLSHCKQRNDDWAFTAQGRIEYFGKDLHAADSLYHRSCDIHFRTNRGIPMQHQVGIPEKKARKDIRRKEASIGQCIKQAVRPRAVVAPLQIGLAVQMHHHFRSRFIVDTLAAMGFSSSYSEVQRFEESAAASVAPDVLGGDIHALDAALLFAADNVEHNIITLDGKGTFHGMGMIAGITPGR
ncbi:Hypothetical predicted protein [Paramuricea clavata]|uniref:Uncharacterized protein n=1 Tax=Paramuricea clavata TaxID=317549 RepID=A0A6S7HTT1_PARCT|nr:Hypothetical predicted protein [Paramuricea clavata]